MDDLTKWWDIARVAGAGAALVLGVAIRYLWVAYRDEVAYSKTRDREVIGVLAALTKVIESSERTDNEGTTRILGAVAELKTTMQDLNQMIRNHLLKG